MSDDGDYFDDEVDTDDDGDSDEVDVGYDEDIFEFDDHDDEHDNYDYDDRDGNGGTCYDDNNDAYYDDEDADADDIDVDIYDHDNDDNNEDDDDTDNYDDDNHDAYDDDAGGGDAGDAGDDDDDVDVDDADDDDDGDGDYRNSGIVKKEMEQEGKTTKTSRKRAWKLKSKNQTKKPLKGKAVQNPKGSKSKKRTSLNVAKKSSNNKKRKKLSSVNINPKIIRKFSAGFVRISKTSTRWARRMATKYLEKIHKYCREESKGIYSHFEYTGSFYEHLKTEDANELDILVALDTKDNAHLVWKEVVPGYARIKVTKKYSKYWRFVEDKDGYVVPKKVINWFFGLVQKAIDKDSNKDSSQNSKQVKVPIAKVSENGPAATLIISDQENCKMTLNVDLVPTFLFKSNSKSSSAATDPLEGKRRFVAKPLPEQMVTEHLICSREMLWRRSFSLEEKKKMEHMDKNDKGCRREVVKIIKTIVKNDGPPLAILSSYHVKTAFLHYNFDKGQKDLKWGRKHLAERFKGLMEYLRQKVSEKCLSHFFIKKLNLLLELSDASLVNIEGRLNRLINNENELKKVLKQPEPRYNRKHKKRKLDDDDDDDDIDDVFHDEFSLF